MYEDELLLPPLGGGDDAGDDDDSDDSDDIDDSDDDDDDGSFAALCACITGLSWDGPVDAAKAERETLYPLVGVPPPKRKTPAPKTFAKPAAAVDDYASLVKSAGY
jgi:hypothetical protein